MAQRYSNPKREKLTTGHLLIGTEYVSSGELRTFIVPATFTGNGLAMHRAIGTAKGYAVTHVSSGLQLRGGMKMREAKAMLLALAGEDWTFNKDAVTADHADRARAAYEAACK